MRHKTGKEIQQTQRLAIYLFAERLENQWLLMEPKNTFYTKLCELSRQNDSEDENKTKKHDVSVSKKPK